jgi:hypothetical protein
MVALRHQTGAERGLFYFALGTSGLVSAKETGTMSSKLISYEAAARAIDADNPPHRKTLKRWPDFPKSVKPSGKINGKEWLVAAEFHDWLRKQTQRRAS